MNVVVTGGTGLIGQKLCEALAQRGDQVTVLARHPGRVERVLFPKARSFRWDAMGELPPQEALDRADAVVHLAGESIAAKRWSAAQKALIRDSRLNSTDHLVAALTRLSKKPDVLVSASAVGYYGDRGNEELTEEAAAGNDFLARTAVEWEARARRAGTAGIRVITLRIGVVLTPDGGALKQMLPPFKLGLGGTLGSGRQWMSWIHISDLVSAMLYLIDRQGLAGVFNATAPEPITNAEFSRTLARVLRRPCLIPAPAFALKLMLGEMAQALLLQGQRVVPKRLLASGFQFRFPALEPALRNLLKQ
ncbi:MAG: TIGR01777 family protein [Acidobacteria bacterium]|nr:TIGR01777 family protein [Acidobacteriota bacterium]